MNRLFTFPAGVEVRGCAHSFSDVPSETCAERVVAGHTLRTGEIALGGDFDVSLERAFRATSVVPAPTQTG